MNSLSDTFDDFVDDILSSDVNLLKGELDFLVMQHLFKSIEPNKCCMSIKSSSPLNKLTSEESRSSTKSSKVSERGFTIKNLFLPLSSH